MRLLYFWLFQSLSHFFVTISNLFMTPSKDACETDSTSNFLMPTAYVYGIAPGVFFWVPTYSQTHIQTCSLPCSTGTSINSPAPLVSQCLNTQYCLPFSLDPFILSRHCLGINYLRVLPPHGLPRKQ